MNTCCTCGTHAKTIDLGIQQTELSPKRRPDEKLEFVEHVLDVLIDSRYGYGNPYSRLGERPVTTGNSQMFANVRLLSAAEINEHLNGDHRHFQTSLLCGFLCELCVRKKEFHAKSAKDAKRTQRFWDVRCMSPPLADGTQVARGSPTFLGTWPPDPGGFAVSHCGEAVPLCISPPLFPRELAERATEA
ncbi:MAG: hypothetical protein ABL959_17125 [Pyrinomonadaceae bacterium]